jgi:hypothetical protein
MDDEGTVILVTCPCCALRWSAAANAVWQVCLEPEAGWRPVWEPPLKSVMANIKLSFLCYLLLCKSLSIVDI